MKHAILLLALIACRPEAKFDAENPARGPGQFVGNGEPVSDGNFLGVDQSLPAPNGQTPPSGINEPDCNQSCQNYCDSLQLQNPLNRGMCSKLWGVGLQTQPINEREACRRMFVDMVDRNPSAAEIESDCVGKDLATLVKDLMATDDFVLNLQKRYADFFLYDTLSSNVEAIWDLDELVGKLHKGLISYDHFAAVASTHPALTRKYSTREDIAEAVFTRFLGRPPFEFEKADFGKLFTLWKSSYIDHKPLSMRIPDAFVGYDCVDPNGNVDPALEGQCTSSIFGLHKVILTPDYRVAGSYGGREMWHGILRQDEWEILQTPGRLLSQNPIFWEKVVQDVIEQYFGYRLGTYSPAARQELVDYLLQYNGDVRALHFAIVTSFVYRQSSAGTTPTEHIWTSGPRKQLDAESWFKTVTAKSEASKALCDHRISRPEEFVFSGSDAAKSLIRNSRWELNDDDQLLSENSNLVRTLGGCPTNGADKRFNIVSILTTSTQLNLVNQLCDPKSEGGDKQIPASSLLPSGIDAQMAGNATRAQTIGESLTRDYLGRNLTAAESTKLQDVGTQCAAANCTSEELARVICFSTLSSAELLFY